MHIHRNVARVGPLCKTLKLSLWVGLKLATGIQCNSSRIAVYVSVLWLLALGQIYVYHLLTC